MYQARICAFCISVMPLIGCFADAADPFSFSTPGLDSNRFRITTFAEGLNYPVGMAELSDGSMIAAVSRGASFFGSSTGQVIRFVDSDDNGVADSQNVLVNRVPIGRLTSLRIAGDYVFVTGQASSILMYEMGKFPADAWKLVSDFQIEYPGRWLHPHSALATREIDGRIELFFNLGSDTNFARTTRTATLRSDDFGVQTPIHGDSIYRIDFRSQDDGLSVNSVTQIATGLRNAAGMTFDPTTGDLYVQDNGIDGIRNANEPTSADELNRIAKGRIGNEIVDFGFPNAYIEYRTGNRIGDRGEQPVVAYLPLPDPADGSEAEGPNDISFGPRTFPLPMRNGVFVGMHGKFSLSGQANEENPVVMTDLRDNSYYHIISNEERNIGHLDGITSTHDSLFLADISPGGGFGGGHENSGKIYQIKSLYPEIDDLSAAVRHAPNDPFFDLDNDGDVDRDDRTVLVHEVHLTVFGDSNLDGQFDAADLVHIFRSGRYETGQAAKWSDGDWTGDALFDTKDLINAFEDGKYELGFTFFPVRESALVPESCSTEALVAIFLLCGYWCRNHRSVPGDNRFSV